MRLILLALLMLAVAACARAPRAVEPAPAPAPAPAGATGQLIGMTASELVARFGQPGFTVQEGVGTKLQWARNGCVLDAYLYPPENGHPITRVTHVDTRRPSGDRIEQTSCLAMLAR